MGKIENDIYYGSDGQPAHRGAVESEGKIYYAGHDGELFKNGRKTIHHGMSNGLLHHGSYYFDADGVCDRNSFKNVKHKHHSENEKHRHHSAMKSSGKIKQKCVIVLSSICLALILGIAIYAFLCDGKSSYEPASGSVSSSALSMRHGADSGHRAQDAKLICGGEKDSRQEAFGLFVSYQDDAF